MALPPAICQIISEAQRLYNNAFSQMDETDDDSLAVDLERKFEDFALSLDALLADLSQTLQATSREISDLVNPNQLPMYLHLDAHLPARSAGYPEQALPDSGPIASFYKGKGRIHCLGLAGSYVPQAVKLIMRQYDEEMNQTREKTICQVPICHNSSPPPASLHIIPSPFWAPYCWMNTPEMPHMVSHASCTLPYFELFGYASSTTYTHFLVEATPANVFWSAGIAFESQHQHGSAYFGEGL